MEKTIIIESIIGDNGDCEDGEDGEDDGEDNDDGDVSEDGNMVVGTGDNLWYSLSWQSLLSRSRDALGGECQCHRVKTINMTFILHCLKKLKNDFLSFSQTITW